MKTIITVAAFAALAAATPAFASTTIDFESPPQGFVTNPVTIGDATFSTPTGDLYIGDQLLDGNNEICAFSSGCIDELDVSFASAISGLSFLAVGDDSASTLTVLLDLVGGATQTVLFTMDGDPSTYDTIDLSTYSNILGLSLTTDDFFGLAYDDFAYDVAAATPE